MKIAKIDNTSFTAQTKTSKLFESLLLKNFESVGTEGMKRVTKDLYPEVKFVGHRGYRYYALKVREAVMKNYPELAKDIENIQAHIKHNPDITKPELADYVKPFLEKYGENIDIVV